MRKIVKLTIAADKIHQEMSIQLSFLVFLKNIKRMIPFSCNQKPHKVIKIGLIHSMPSPIIVESQKNTFPFLSLYDKQISQY